MKWLQRSCNVFHEKWKFLEGSSFGARRVHKYIRQVMMDVNILLTYALEVSSNLPFKMSPLPQSLKTMLMYKLIAIIKRCHRIQSVL